MYGFSLLDELQSALMQFRRVLGESFCLPQDLGNQYL